MTWGDQENYEVIRKIGECHGEGGERGVVGLEERQFLLLPRFRSVLLR